MQKKLNKVQAQGPWLMLQHSATVISVIAVHMFAIVVEDVTALERE